MSGKLASFKGVVVLAVVTAVTYGYFEHKTIQEMRSERVATVLQPIARLLTENQALMQELQADPFTEKDLGVLESYLTKIRRDGIATHTDMKQRLDTLAENNTVIVTLIEVNAGHVETLAFTAEADKFRNYASAWRDRWNSVMELFMAGGNYATSQVAFPHEFPAAVSAEIASEK